jgi:hypothetical protein
MVYEHLHNIANIFKQRRLIRMQSLSDKRLKPRIVAPKLPSRRGCMNFDKHLHNIHISYILLIKLLTFFFSKLVESFIEEEKFLSYSIAIIM